MHGDSIFVPVERPNHQHASPFIYSSNPSWWALHCNSQKVVQKIPESFTSFGEERCPKDVGWAFMFWHRIVEPLFLCLSLSLILHISPSASEIASDTKFLRKLSRIAAIIFCNFFGNRANPRNLREWSRFFPEIYT